MNVLFHSDFPTKILYAFLISKWHDISAEYHNSDQFRWSYERDTYTNTHTHTHRSCDNM